MDILDDILATLNFRGVFYFRTEFSGSWSIRVPDYGSAARFHFVVRGHCHVQLASGAIAVLEAGDLILIPKGRHHILADEVGKEAAPLETVLEQNGYDGNGVFAVGQHDPEASTQMVCGHFNFREGADHPLLRALPVAIVVRQAQRSRQPWLDDTLGLIARRIFTNDLGSIAAVKRLSEIVFIETLKASLDQSPELASILAGLQEKPIARALEAIHERPDRDWSLESMAEEAGMSRSRFAERFARILGVPPMTYLTEWRLQRALALLDNPRTSVQQVAQQVGYRSPAAFSRAFSAKFARSPKAHRTAERSSLC